MLARGVEPLFTEGSDLSSSRIGSYLIKSSPQFPSSQVISSPLVKSRLIKSNPYPQFMSNLFKSIQQIGSGRFRSFHLIVSIHFSPHQTFSNHHIGSGQVRSNQTCRSVHVESALFKSTSQINPSNQITSDHFGSNLPFISIQFSSCQIKSNHTHPVKLERVGGGEFGCG